MAKQFRCFYFVFALVQHKVAGVKVYLRQTWNFRSHAVSACIGLWCHRPMLAPHRLMHACTACIAPWHHRLMHAVTAWAVLLWFCLRYTFISTYFGYSMGYNHRYLKNIDCLSFVMCPLLAPHLPRHIFAAATNSTNETSKAGDMSP